MEGKKSSLDAYIYMEFQITAAVNSRKFFSNMLMTYGLFSVVGFEVPDKFVVGYALDYNEYFRDLNVSNFSHMFLSI